jgi:hypothetical protein
MKVTLCHRWKRLRKRWTKSKKSDGIASDPLVRYPVEAHKARDHPVEAVVLLVIDMTSPLGVRGLPRARVVLLALSSRLARLHWQGPLAKAFLFDRLPPLLLLGMARQLFVRK